jgi:hypothetical protein
MELIERYLQAVKFWLPKQQKDDIIAELSEDIHAQIEEQETALGHKLSEAEVEAFLKRRGRPVVVANRYLPQQYLIGPLLFPVYRFVLKIVALCYLLPWLLVALWLKTWMPSAEQSIPGPFLVTVLFALGGVTVVFAILERVQEKSRFLENWNPGKLPPVRNPNLIARSSSAVELAVNLLFFVWWARYMYAPGFVLLSPLWLWFFWGFLVLSLANAALAAVNLMHPYWTGSRALLRLGTDCAGGALFCWLMKADVLTEISIASLTAERSAAFTNLINGWLEKSFPIAVAVCVVIAAVDVYRILRVHRTPKPGLRIETFLA